MIIFIFIIIFSTKVEVNDCGAVPATTLEGDAKIGQALGDVVLNLIEVGGRLRLWVVIDVVVDLVGETAYAVDVDSIFV